jgi:hypothetical protein
MAKFTVRYTLKKDNGTQIGNPIEVQDATSRSAANALVDAEVQNRINQQQAGLTDLQDIQTQFGS